MQEPELRGELAQFLGYALGWMNDIPASDAACLSGMPAFDKMHAAVLTQDPDSSVDELKSAFRAAIAWIDAVPKSMVASFPAMSGFDRDAGEELLDMEPDALPAFCPA